MPPLCDVLKNSKLEKNIRDILVFEIFGISREQAFLEPEKNISPDKNKKYKNFEKMILSGYPYQYLTKKALFFGNEFYVNRNVLIPRPETEQLLDLALKHLNRSKKNGFRILDIGTGSGCIIISIYLALKSANKSEFFGSDISEKALNVARKNAGNLRARISFVKSDLFSKITGKFDLICANLPYGGYLDSDYKKLHDPKIALFGGKSGFETIENCLKQIGDHLEKDGLAILEIGYNQRRSIEKIQKSLTKFNFRIYKDLSDFDRVLTVSFGRPHQV